MVTRSGQRVEIHQIEEPSAPVYLPVFDVEILDEQDEVVVYHSDVRGHTALDYLIRSHGWTEAP